MMSRRVATIAVLSLVVVGLGLGMGLLVLSHVRPARGGTSAAEDGARYTVERAHRVVYAETHHNKVSWPKDADEAGLVVVLRRQPASETTIYSTDFSLAFEDSASEIPRRHCVGISEGMGSAADEVRWSTLGGAVWRHRLAPTEPCFALLFSAPREIGSFSLERSARLTSIDSEGDRNSFDVGRDKPSNENAPAPEAAGPPDAQEGRSGSDASRRAGRPRAQDGEELIKTAYNGEIESVRGLLREGVDVNARNAEDITALFMASYEGHVDVVKTLLKNGAKVDIVTKSGHDTALIVASQNGHLDVVKALIQAESDVNATNNRGATPLILASAKGYGDVVRTLLENGADASIETHSEGTTALAAARRGNHSDIVRMLEEARGRRKRSSSVGE
jgi:hypothetical protein